MTRQIPDTPVTDQAAASSQSDIETTNLYLAKPEYAAMLAQARQTQGAHLMLGHGGCFLHYARGRTLSVYDAKPIKAACIHAGVPVIDVRFMDYDKLWRLAVDGPMIAIGEEPRFFIARALSTEALEVLARDYRAAGAEIHNIPLDLT